MRMRLNSWRIEMSLKHVNGPSAETDMVDEVLGEFVAREADADVLTTMLFLGDSQEMYSACASAIDIVNGAANTL